MVERKSDNQLPLIWLKSHIKTITLLHFYVKQLRINHVHHVFIIVSYFNTLTIKKRIHLTYVIRHEESKGHGGLTAFPQCKFHLEFPLQENEFLYYHVIIDLLYLGIPRYCIVGLQFLTCPIQYILLTIELIWGWKLKFANVWTFSPCIFIETVWKVYI